MKKARQSAHVFGGLALLGCVGCAPHESTLANDMGDAATLDPASYEEKASGTTLLTLQAESFSSQSGCSVSTSHDGYHGSGFVDYGASGTWIQWTNVSVPTAGTYQLVFRYAAASNARPCSISVNGTTAASADFGSTGSWTTWATTSVSASLKAGNNTIRVTASTSNGGPNLDEMAVQSSTSSGGSGIQHIFVIAMENSDSSRIYGNTSSAPYINNTLLPRYAHATNFNDALPISTPSEPHYVWMEAGAASFSDHTFTNDADPSSSNSTSNTNHLVTQIKNATNGVTWRTYQEGLSSSTGSCPVRSSGFYAAKHDPFVFFQDVAGNPPSASNAYCAAHHRAYSSFASDLSANDVASYTFITPNLCHDMHGASGCSDSNAIRAGDTWLSNELPRLIDYANSHAGVIFLVWDEGDSTSKLPFIAIGPGVKTGYTGSVSYTHSSLIKSIEKILNLPTLSNVSNANLLSDLFNNGL